MGMHGLLSATGLGLGSRLPKANGEATILLHSQASSGLTSHEKFSLTPCYSKLVFRPRSSFEKQSLRSYLQPTEPEPVF